jgi:hypothetical protein
MSARLWSAKLASGMGGLLTSGSSPRSSWRLWMSLPQAGITGACSSGSCQASTRQPRAAIALPAARSTCSTPPTSTRMWCLACGRCAKKGIESALPETSLPGQRRRCRRRRTEPISSAPRIYSKPKSPRQVVREALTLAGVAPPEMAYVGDRLDNDVLPARALGMVSVFWNAGRGTDSRKPPGGSPGDVATEELGRTA